MDEQNKVVTLTRAQAEIKKLQYENELAQIDANRNIIEGQIKGAKVELMKLRINEKIIRLDYEEFVRQFEAQE